MTDKRIAVVTGAGSGIGRSAALALARRDFAVVLAGRNLQSLQETAKLAVGASMLPVQTDVTQPDSVTQLPAIPAKRG